MHTVSLEFFDDLFISILDIHSSEVSHHGKELATRVYGTDLRIDWVNTSKASNFQLENFNENNLYFGPSNLTLFLLPPAALDPS